MRPQYSPWGEIQHCVELCPGAYQVSTASHGGVMAKLSMASKLFSRAARAYSFVEGGYSTWYVDRLGDLRYGAIHHDGTNHYLYRVYKDSASPPQIELLKEKLYRGIATRADITRVTRRLGDDIAKVYGFSISRQRQAAAMER